MQDLFPFHIYALFLHFAGKYSNAESKIVVDAVKEYAAANSISVEVRDAVCFDMEGCEVTQLVCRVFWSRLVGMIL